MTILEQHDELGLPWDEWADGRVRRLVKGRDFLQSADALKEAAENAAQRLDKVAVTVKEIRYGNVFVWFQFVEYQIELGDPCPCGSYDLQRVNLQFAECGSCKATLLVLEPKKRKEPPDEGAADDDPLLDSLLHGGAAPSSKEKTPRAGKEKTPRAKTRNPRSDLTRLGPFREIKLFRQGRDEEGERFYGSGLGPGGRPWLMVVDFPLLDGEWVQGADYPGGWMHAVWSVAVEPFKDIVDLERLNTRAPDLRIDDPLVDDYSDLEPSDREPEHSQDHSGAHGTIEPPVKLAGLEDVKLFSYAKNSPEIERFVGYGRTSEGEEVILTARFRLQDGRRIEDPQLPGQPLNEVNCVPLSPFGDLIEPKPLFSREPDLSIENPAVDLMADDLASRSR